MRRLILAVVFTVLGPLASFAEPGIPQGNPARLSIQGRVLDPMRAPIAGARVTASPDDQGAPLSTLTDQRGEFTLTVDSGSYTMRVEAPGFLEASQRVTVPQSAGEASEFVLQIAGPREAVTVSADGSLGSVISSATKTPTPLRDVPQAVTVVTTELMQEQLMTSIADVVRYVPGVTTHQGENNRDQVIIRGNSSSADFFVNGVRDDVQYYRDLYNLDRVEALKGPNAMIFGRGGGGGVINRVTKEAGFRPLREVSLLGGDVRQQAIQRGRWRAVQRQGRLPDERHVRELRQLPPRGWTGTLRRLSHCDNRAEQPDEDHAGVPVPQ